MVPFLIAASLTIEFIGPCHDRPLLRAKVETEQTSSVGKVTIETLEKFKINYKGSEAGINSAFGSPIGIDAMEVISDSEMRSYGWCFEVDGKVPEHYPDSISVSSAKKVKWFYGFAHYLIGNWISQCEPAHKLKPDFLCRPNQSI